MVNKFVALYLSNLSVEEVFSLCKSTIDISQFVTPELGAIGNAALAQLVDVTQLFGASLNKNQRSALTPEAQTLERLRDTDLREIFRINKTYLKSNNEERKMAASILQLFLSPYKNADKLPIDVESGVLNEMLIKYNASNKLKTAAQTVGIDSAFESLANHNAQFDAIFNSRNIEKADRPASATSYKSKAAAAYTQYCTAIEQTLQFMPSDTLLALFNQLNELRKTYRSLETKSKK